MTPPDPTDLERILLTGSWGTGKSRSWAVIANWLKKTGSDAKVYVIDTEMPSTIKRTRETFDNLDNVVGVSASDWESVARAAETYQKIGKPGDWLTVDNAANPWDYVQAYFIEKVHEMPPEKAYLDWATEGMKGGGPIGGEYGKDWGVINKLYGAYMGKVQRFPGHVLMTTPSEEVKEPDRAGKGGDSLEIRQQFGRFGVKPKGQKALAFQCHTVLWLANVGDARKNEWRVTTMKDRGNREYLTGVEYSDLVTGYLMKIGGWKMAAATLAEQE